jgi:branched-chain amino acid aminotransferase
MSGLSNSRIAWFNGEFMPEGQVMIPFRDRSWKYGDGAFDMTRTFEGTPFRLKEHIDRFYHSLRYLRIDPGVSPKEMVSLSEEVVARNEHLRQEAGDWWVGQRVSRGVDAVGDEGWNHTGPNVVIEILPLPLKKRAKFYRDGADVMLTSLRRTSPSMLSPRAKMHNYLNMIVAEMPVKAADPDAWAILLDENGNLAEGMGSNIFIVRDGGLMTPRHKFVLPGVSRQMTIDLATKLNIPCKEQDLDLFDAETADEIFLTSTSMCIMPVRSFNGGKVGDGKIPGPITSRLTKAYIEEVGCDFVQQYLDRLE